MDIKCSALIAGDILLGMTWKGVFRRRSYIRFQSWIGKIRRNPHQLEEVQRNNVSSKLKTIGLLEELSYEGFGGGVQIVCPY
jgi:hypothetical protein